MKGVSNWALVGGLAGGLFAVLSAIRYFALYPDLDRALAYIVIGLMICSISWLYNKSVQLSNTLTAVEDYLADKK